MEIIDMVLNFISEYGSVLVPVLAIVLEFALRKVKSKKPLSVADKGLDILGYGLSKFGLSSFEKLVKKIREVLNNAVPERLK